MSLDCGSFNPRTRVGCDGYFSLIAGNCWFQSTHPCGVRPHQTKLRVVGQVSIHAPVWGATNQSHVSRGERMFQSTHPCGVRLNGYEAHLAMSIVSIHAPVWGATSTKPLGEPSILFQSTHPCGVRPHLCT